MGFRNGAYATVWGSEQGKGRFWKVRLTTSHKNRTTQEYETDFSGFCTFIGKAAEEAPKLHERDRIRLTETEVTNSYDKEKKVTYVNYNVYAFELAEGNGGGNRQPAQKAAVDEGASGNDTDGGSEDLPF